MASTVKTKAIRALPFGGVMALVLVLAMGVASRVHYRGWTLLAYLTDHLVRPGGAYQSLRRFREASSMASSREGADVVVFGSSHAYRGFDPRLFAAAGYRLMNLGSTNQTPLNSRFLAERYLPRLKPRLVLFEIYYATLAGDGLESSRDLVVNTPWSWEMQRMAFATRNLGAMEYTAAKGLGMVGDLTGVAQRPIAGERYVPGGYCEAGGPRETLSPRKPFTVELLPRQLVYLAEATKVAQSMGARVVWVTHPLPRDHRQALTNYEQLHGRIATTAVEAGVPYWNFDGQLGLDPLAHFTDFHHLDAEGVRLFDEALIARLREEGLLE